jgi:hypothetical protein
MAEVAGKKVYEDLVLPLGEAPREEELEEVLELIWEREVASSGRRSFCRPLSPPLS